MASPSLPPPQPNYSSTPSPKRYLRNDPSATVHSWTQHLRVPPVAVASSAPAIAQCDPAILETIHGRPGELGPESPVAIVFVPDLAHRLSRHAVELLSGSPFANIALKELQDDDDDDDDGDDGDTRISQLNYIAASLNKATTPTVSASTDESYTRRMFTSISTACTEIASLYLQRSLLFNASAPASLSSSGEHPDLEVHVNSSTRALLELENGDSTQRGESSARGLAAADGVMRKIDTRLSQLAADGTYVSSLQGLPGTSYAGSLVFVMKLLRSALQFPQCSFLGGFDWNYALPMYMIKLDIARQPATPLPSTRATLLAPRQTHLHPAKPALTPSTSFTPYILAIGALVPISGSVATDGHSLPHMIIGGSLSDSMSDELLSMIKTDARYKSLAEDIRHAGLDARNPSQSSSASAAPGDGSGSSIDTSGGLAASSASSTAQQDAAFDLHTRTTLATSPAEPAVLAGSSSLSPAEPTSQSTTGTGRPPAGFKQPRRSSGNKSISEDTAGEAEASSETTIRSVSMHELQTLHELRVAYMYSNGLLDEFFTMTALTTPRPALTPPLDDDQRRSIPVSRASTPNSLPDTSPEPGIPILALECDPLGGGADGVVHRVVGFEEDPLVAKISHADRLAAAKKELSIYRTIESVSPDGKLVPRLIRALQGTPYQDSESIVLVLEDGGPCLRSWTGLTPDERSTLYDNLRELHLVVGVFHGDVRPSNVLRSSDGRLRFINFGRSFLHECEGDQCEELERLRDSLAL